MANQLLVNPFPAGFDSTQSSLTLNGSLVLAGSAVSTGEPINWTSLIDGIGYNEINYRGNGQHGTGQAYTTGFAVSAGICTCTANNNFSAGQAVSFLGNTQTLSALFNGQVAVILTASSTQFTFATTNTGTTTTTDVGIAFRYNVVSLPVPAEGSTLTATVTALSASGTTLTVTAANTYLPGAQVTISVATGTLGPKLAGLTLPVIQSTGTAFTATMPSALSGSTGTGTATGSNPAQPFSVKFWSSLESGYIYQYNATFGTLFVLQAAGFTPAGTNSAPTITTTTGTPATLPIGVDGSHALTQTTGATGITGVQAPVFTGTPVAAGTFSQLAAAAYPSGVLGDVIKYEAKFTRMP